MLRRDNKPNKVTNMKKCFRILIVDDDNNMAQMFSEILKYRGHNVTIVNEGALCINKCHNDFYDIIFMDFHLEDLDGVNVTDVIRNVCGTKSLIFAFTGDDNSHTIKKFKDIGMTGALIKPLDINLINKIMTSLEFRNDLDKKVIYVCAEHKYGKQLILF